MTAVSKGAVDLSSEGVQQQPRSIWPGTTVDEAFQRSEAAGFARSRKKHRQRRVAACSKCGEWAGHHDVQQDLQETDDVKAVGIQSFFLLKGPTFASAATKTLFRSSVEEKKLKPGCD